MVEDLHIVEFQTLSFRFDRHHFAPVSWCSLSLQIHPSAPVAWCLKTDCHIVATLENVVLGLGCCLAAVSWRSMKHKSDPTLDFPGCSKHSNLAAGGSLRSGGYLPRARRWSSCFEKRYTSSLTFKLLTIKRRLKREEGTPSLPGTPSFNLHQNLGGIQQATKLKKDLPTTFLLPSFSHHIPLLCCHSPSTVREGHSLL